MRCDIPAGLLRMGGDDGKAFSSCQILCYIIDDQGIEENTEQGEQPRFYIKEEEGGKGNKKIDAHHGFADIQRGKLPKQHCSNVRTACAGVLVEQYGCPDGWQADGKDQFQQTLVGNGGRERENPFHALNGEGEEKRAVYRPSAKIRADEEKTDEKKQDVDNSDQKRGRYQGQYAPKQDGKAADAAGGKIVGKLKKINADGHQQGAKGEKKKVLKGKGHPFHAILLIVLSLQ